MFTKAEGHMTLIEQAIERLRALPSSDQESAAESVLALLEQYEGDYHLTPEQIEEVRRTEADYLAGKLEVLSVEETEAMWRRLGA